METTKKRVGRPKSEPRTGPLILEAFKTREKTQVDLPADVAGELAEYVTWVEKSSSLKTVDAMSATVEFALRDLFRRDRLWRTLRSQESGAEVPATPPVAQAKAAAPPPPLPPPTSPAKSVPPSSPPTASR